MKKIDKIVKLLKRREYKATFSARGVYITKQTGSFTQNDIEKVISLCDKYGASVSAYKLCISARQRKLG
jgi:hypothetical protein